MMRAGGRRLVRRTLQQQWCCTSGPGNKIEGLYLLEKAAKALKDDTEVRYHLGMAYLDNEHKLEVRRELEFAVQESDQMFAELYQAKAALGGPELQ
jgi:TPR repeat protein